MYGFTSVSTWLPEPQLSQFTRYFPISTRQIPY